MDELKPCPFCNHLPDAESLGEDGYYICCSNIDCESVDGVSPETWNARPIEDALNHEIEVLREKLDIIRRETVRRWNKIDPTWIMEELDR